MFRPPPPGPRPYAGTTELAQQVADPRELILYSRAYCHLCDDMVAALEALQPRYGFSLRIRDVDADPALEARYDVLVPVLTLEGVEICHYVLDEGRLATALRDG